MDTKKVRLLKINDAVEYAAVSRSTIYEEAKAGRLKITKLGHASRIEVSELDRWIDVASANAG